MCRTIVVIGTGRALPCCFRTMYKRHVPRSVSKYFLCTSIDEDNDARRASIHGFIKTTARVIEVSKLALRPSEDEFAGEIMALFP